MSHVVTASAPTDFSDAAHLSAYLWILFVVAQLILAFVVKPKGIVERLIVLFQKQHLLLLLSAIIMTTYIFLPVIKLDGGMMHSKVAAKDLMVNIDFPIIGHYFVFVCLVAALITAGINLLIISLNKFRKLQVIFGWLSIVPAIFTVCYTYRRMTTTEMIQDQLFYYGNIAPVVAVLFIFLAIFFIRREEELVKSVDRLR